MPDVLFLNQPEALKLPPLLKGEIHLWSVSLELSTNQVDSLRPILSDVEKDRADFYKFEQAQISYIVSQAVLRLLLSAYLGIEPAKVNTGAHKKGKPFLINEASIFFNISNSHGLCVFAFSPDAEVGIDVEKIRDLPDIDQLIEKNFTSQEQVYIQKEPEFRLSRFFQFWTFKESYLKAIGEGMRLTPENLEFSLEDGVIRLQSLNYGFDAVDWQFFGFSQEGDYTGTLTYTGNDTVIRELALGLNA